jgi:hypothetical protein
MYSIVNSFKLYNIRRRVTKMDISSIFVSAIFLFAIIYFAVRLAIIPLIPNSDEDIAYKQDFGLVKLRDIDILSPDELDEVIELYQNRDVENQDNYQYQKYAKILDELKEIGYFNDETYSSRLDKLKEYFKVS